MNIKKSKKVILGIVILGIWLFSHNIYAAQASLNKVVAVVNNSALTQSELNKKMMVIKQQLTRSHAAVPSASLLRQQALDELIDSSLQVQLAKRNNIQISDRELDTIVSSIARKNQLTVEQLKKTLLEQEGIGFNEFRSELRKNGLISRVQQAFLGKEIVVSDKEVEDVLRHPPKVENRIPMQYHVFDILFETSDSITKEQLVHITAVANKMAQKLRHGADLNDVISESQKTLQEHIVRGNDLGWRKINELPELFSPKITKMQVNQVVGPFTAPNGLHLLKLLEIHGNITSSAKLTKDQAYEMVYYHKLAEKLKSWIKELREKAYIEIIK